jgi:hypothetical protein
LGVLLAWPLHTSVSSITAIVCPAPLQAAPSHDVPVNNAFSL